MSVLEAISCGLPALLSDSEKSASVQFALNEKFIFRKNEPTDLSLKIDYWVEHRKKLTEYAAKYRLHSRSFAIEKSADKIDKLYRRYARN
jgi:glycosyltransferase involved in cell wall biosynthesis